MSPKTRALIVEDSALVRRALTESLSRSPGIEGVGTESVAYLAPTRILDLHPEVMTLDVEMPGADGSTFLKLLMQRQANSVMKPESA